ncbi:urease accessory protein UreD [Streptomyces lasalocidi]|uniref:urease accessory protein UreD n=1 Tax=Streptomyces lasalocidi TaxID=324833 RepID=UPI001F5005DB|nr:urease accessory protein UreD [Streptomyces lasalocidi]
MRATALIRAAYNGRVTTLPQLRSDGPFHLRRMRTDGPSATVGIIGAMSAPLGGDRLTLDITAEDRAELEVTTAAATLALRGPTTEAATYDVRLTAGEHASLRWRPQPLISAAGSNLHQTYTVELAATSRLVLRDEQLLGRADEEPGHLVTRIVVRFAGRPLLDQQTAYGAPEPGWDGPAVLDGHRATGQLLVVDPRLDALREPVLLGNGATDGCAVLAPLAGGPALLATAVAPTTSAVRELLDEAHALALAGWHGRAAAPGGRRPTASPYNNLGVLAPGGAVPGVAPRAHPGTVRR